jgi:TonB family protein
MHVCAADRAHEAERRLAALVQEVGTRVGTERAAELQRVQTAWREYRDQHCSWDSEAVEGGSMQPTWKAMCIANLTEARINDLKTSLCEVGGSNCPAARRYDAPQGSKARAMPGQDQVFSADVVQEKPEMLSAPQLVYPKPLREAGIEGVVMVQAIIDTTGRAEPNSVRVLQSANPGFDLPAKDHVLKALFRPARVYGRAVRVLVQVPVTFTINTH